MNKTEFIAAVAEKAGLSKVDAQKAVNAFAEVVAEQLQAGEKITLLGFGTFSVKESPAREITKPGTSEKMTVAARKVAKFKAGAGLKL